MNVLFKLFIWIKSLGLMEITGASLNRRIHNMRRIFFSILFLLLSNCIAITSIKDKDYVIEKDTKVLVKRIFLECDCKFSVNGKFADGANRERFATGSLSAIEKDFEGSGLFLVSNENETYQYKVKVLHTYGSEQEFGYNFIASMTLLILPFFGDVKWNFSYEVRDLQDKLITNVRREGEQRIVMQWLLIFAMPFYWPFSEENHVFARLNKSAANEIYKKIQSYEIDLNKSR